MLELAGKLTRGKYSVLTSKNAADEDNYVFYLKDSRRRLRADLAFKEDLTSLQVLFEGHPKVPWKYFNRRTVERLVVPWEFT